MAAKKGVKKESKIPANELELNTRIAKLAEIKSPTDGQKAQIKGLKTEVASSRFARLAFKRTTRALRDIAAIGKLTGAGYHYTQQQSENILTALKDEVNKVAGKFSGPAEKETTTFTL